MSANTHILRKSFWIFLFSLISISVSANKRYWISASTANWNSTTNWSSTSGGASGASVPGSNDTCYFDGNGLGRCDINANVNVKRFEIVSTYTDTITQNAFTITVGTGGMKLAGAATFIGSSSSITLSGTMENTACKFTSTSGTLEIKSAHFYLTGSSSFFHNNGLLKFSKNGTGTDTIKIDLGTSTSDTAFYDLEINNPNSGTSLITKIISGGILITHNAATGGAGSKTLYQGTIDLKGDITLSGTGALLAKDLNNGKMRISGTGTQNIYGNGTSATTQMTNLEIDKPSGILYLNGIISTRYNLSLLQGSINSGTSRLYFRDYSNGTTIKGNFTGSNSINKFYLIATTTGILTIDDTLQVNDSITFAKSSSLVKGAHAGVINAKGHIYYKGNVATSGDVTLIVSGSGTQELRSERIYSNSATTLLPKFVINKSSTDTLKLVGTIISYVEWTYVSGVINSTNARVYFPFGRGPVITGSHSLSRVVLATDASSGSSDVTINPGTELTVTDSLLLYGIGSGSGEVLNGVLNLKGHMVINTPATGAAGNGTIRINGTADQHFFGSVVSTNFPGRLCNIEVDKSSGTLYLHNNISIVTNSSTSTRINFIRKNGTIDPGNSIIYTGGNTGLYDQTAGSRLPLNILSYIGGQLTIGVNDTVQVDTFIYKTTTAIAKIDSGVVEVTGDLLDSNTYTSTGMIGTSTFLFDGIGTQALRGSGTQNTGFLPKVIINKPSGTLTLSGIITAGHDWEYIKGNIDPTTSKVYFTGTAARNIDAEGTSSTMSFYDVTINATRNLTGDIKVSNNLVINSSSTLAQSTYGLSFGSYINNGTHSGTGPISLIGNGYHSFTKSGGVTTNFGTVTVNRSGGSLSLASPINITGSMSFSKGIIKTTSTNLLKFADNATVSGGSDSGYVMGPVIKTGNDSIVFPLGDTSITYHPYRPISITAPSSSTDAFTANYYHAPAPNPDDLPDTLQGISNCEYWTLTRNTGSSNVKTAVWWSEGDCPVYANDAIEIANYDDIAKKWIPIGGTIADNDTLDGLMRIVSPNNVLFTFVGPTQIGIAKKITPGYPLVERSYTSQYYLTTGKVLNFEYYEDYNDADQKLTYTIKRLSNSKTELSQASYALTVVPGTNRYTMNLNTISPGTFTSGYYLLEITNEKQEKFYLRFKI